MWAGSRQETVTPSSVSHLRHHPEPTLAIAAGKLIKTNQLPLVVNKILWGVGVLGIKIGIAEININCSTDPPRICHTVWITELAIRQAIIRTLKSKFLEHLPRKTAESFLFWFSSASNNKYCTSIEFHRVVYPNSIINIILPVVLLHYPTQGI